MTDQQLEQRLRAWYRDEIGFTEPAPMSLRDVMANIPLTVEPAALGSRRNLVLLAVAAMLVVAAIGSAIAIGSGLINPPTPFPRPPAPDAENGLIAFVEPVGIGGLNLVNADGSGQTTLPDLLATSPLSWSPDGTRFVFAASSDIGGEIRQAGIRVANADGSGAERLPGTELEDLNPAWSPDGLRVVFSRPDSDGGFDLFLTTIDGAEAIQLTSGPDLDLDPAWSPDGAQVVFSRSAPDEAGSRLLVVLVDGGSVQPLTDGGEIVHHPAWSPDGSQIAYSRRELPPPGEPGLPTSYSPPWDVWMMASDGSDRRMVAGGPSSELHPAWSPDGALIVFSSNRGARAAVYVMDADGANIRQVALASEGGVPPWPTWAVAVHEP